MTLQECYAALGGDYAEVLGHLRAEERVERFLVMFLSDDSHERLVRSLDSGDDEEAFRAAHTLKGVCQNLSFTRLYQSSAKLTEALRGGRAGDVEGLARAVNGDYQQTVQAIQTLQRERGGEARQAVHS